MNQPDLFTPRHHPCLPTLSRIAAAGSAERLAFIGPRFALGCGGGRFTIRAYSVTGRGGSWAEAAGNWAAGALDWLEKSTMKKGECAVPATLYIKTEIRGNRTDAHCNICGADGKLVEFISSGRNGSVAVSEATHEAKKLGFVGFNVVVDGLDLGETAKRPRRARVKRHPAPDPLSDWGPCPDMRGR